MIISVVGPTHPHKGGISHFTTLLVKEMRQFHKVNLYSWTRQYPSKFYPVKPTDSESKVAIETPAVFSLDILNPISWIKTAVNITAAKSELVIFTWVTPIQGPVYAVMGLVVKLIRKTKIMFVCHNVFPHERHWYDYPLTRIAWMFADIFTVHSREEKHEIEKHIPKKEIKLAFHPQYDIFSSGPPDKIAKLRQSLHLKSRVLLFFGYIRPYKGLSYLLDAMKEIIKIFPDLSLMVVGEFWSGSKSEYLKTVRTSGLENNVIFIDKYVPNEEVGNYFALSDILVVPYISATQSGVTQIAASFKKPVISTNVGGLTDSIIDGVNGFIVPPQDSTAIAEAVVKYYQQGLQTTGSVKKPNLTWGRYISIITSNV